MSKNCAKFAISDDVQHLASIVMLHTVLWPMNVKSLYVHFNVRCFLILLQISHDY